MNLYVAIPTLLAATVLQIAIAPKVTILQAKPDLVLVVVVAWAVVSGAQGGMTWGVIGGLLLDFLGSVPFGTNVISLALVAFLVAQAHLGVVETNLLLALGAMLVGSVVHDLTFLLVLQVTGSSVPWVADFVRVVLPSAALNALIMPVFYWLFVWLHRRSKPIEGLHW